MADPITLGVVGSWAALEGIKFLYGQAGELLRAWRERRHDVPIASSPALDHEPEQRPADPQVLAQEAGTLVDLVGGLAPYAGGMADIDPSDAALAERAGRVRAILEAVYGQRFTFRGEEREPTGTTVSVSQVLGRVAGQVIGVEADAGSDADVQIRQAATSVEPDGSIVGYKGKIGG